MSTARTAFAKTIIVPAPGDKPWRDSAEKLAFYANDNLVNRTDIYGRYDRDWGQFTAKDGLTLDKIERHFRPLSTADIIGLHTTRAEEFEGPDGELIVSCTSRWCTNDIDHHADGLPPDFNFDAALFWHRRALKLGIHPLLVDTNGNGGFRNFILFSDPVRTELLYHFIRWLQRDWKGYGFPVEPEAFPKQPAIEVLKDFEDTHRRCGNWVRLFGRHHKRPHNTRFWDYRNDRWLEGQDAVDYLLDQAGDDPTLIPGAVQDLVKAAAASRKVKPADWEGEEKTFTDFTLAAEALRHIRDRARDYDSWIETGQALFCLGDRGLVLWDEWSKTAPDKYEPGVCEAKWKTFHRNGVALGSIFHWAKKRGWTYPQEVAPFFAIPKPSANGPAPTIPPAPADVPIVKKDGSWVSCIYNARLWLEDPAHGKVIRYDRFLHEVLVEGKKIADELVVSFTAEIEAGTRTGWAQDHVRSAVLDIAHRNDFSSLTEWLDGLQWDGISRVDSFFEDAFGCEENSYTRACGKVFFLTGAARAYRPGCQADVMVVLIGPQGIGKSTGTALLCPVADWYTDDLGCDLHDRKAGEGLRGKWLVEFSEFSRINRSTLDVVKSFVSRRSDYFRPAYGRTHKDFPRTCFFVGTTNDEHPLHDRENRRFMPLVCKQAKFDWIKRNRDQLWAEAVHRFKAGEKWWVTDPTLLDEVVAKQEDARQQDCWESILDAEIGTWSSVKMEDAARALKIYPDKLDRSTQTRIGNCLKALGFERSRARQNGERFYVWTKP